MAGQHSKDDLVRQLKDHQFPSEHWLGTSVWTENAERNILRLCANAGGGGWSGHLVKKQIIESCTNQKLQKSTSKDSKKQEVFVKEDHPCANGTLRFRSRPRPLSTAEGGKLRARRC